MQIERTAFEKEIMESCPLLYADMVNQRPITESSMAFGFCVGPGWHPLIRELSHGIEKIIRAFPLEEQQAIRVVQVKEKFGSLRFYINFCVEEIEELITEAEMLNSMKRLKAAAKLLSANHCHGRGSFLIMLKLAIVDGYSAACKPHPDSSIVNRL